MPLKLIPPGKRKDNPHYLIRGRLLGRDYEISTQTTDPISAQGFKARFEQRVIEGRIPGPGEAVTFHQAADLYVACKALSRPDQKAVERLKGVIADKLVGQIVTADLAAAGKALYGETGKPDTINRRVYTPGAAIVHFAADNEWCDWKRFKRPKTTPPETRAAADGVGELLAANTEGKQRLLILWLFKHGTRITNALETDCSRVALRERTYDLLVAKRRVWKTFPIDDEVWELLANDPDVQAGAGRLFPWPNRWAVYRWLSPLCDRLGVEFTPHMGRHRLGKELNAAGAGLKTIMGALGQADAKSAIRYTSEDVEIVRAAQQKLGKKLGNGGASV